MNGLRATNTAMTSTPRSTLRFTTLCRNCLQTRNRFTEGKNNTLGPKQTTPDRDTDVSHITYHRLRLGIMMCVRTTSSDQVKEKKREEYTSTSAAAASAAFLSVVMTSVEVPHSFGLPRADALEDRGLASCHGRFHPLLDPSGVNLACRSLRGQSDM